MIRNRVRIIGGAWRSRLVHFAPRPDLRPTPDRVRETLFNWLGQDFTGKSCLDLFAGSGALGFEAASRGARRVVMVERDPVVFRALTASRAALDAAVVELRRADALEFLRADDALYDVVFVDPPYRSDFWPRVASLLPRHLAPEALVYLERATRAGPPPGWTVWREGRAGQVAYRLLKRAEGALP
ncbi:MAG: 16S rRNA (guanine(966)-N(2))-methyltransferase RsmD [Gammaproteobacteria bacterium]